MAKTILGDACAYIQAARAGDKARYNRIGTAMTDEQGRISIKIDTLPIPGSGWTGWINIFPKTERSPMPERPAPYPSSGFDDLDDDIPF